MIKIGSSCFFDEKGQINKELLKRKAREIEACEEDIILVVSGAIALGKYAEGERKSNNELSAVELQSYACIGQVVMINLLKSIFKKKISQILLTKHDLKEGEKIKYLIEDNIEKKRITIINYNDATDFNELRKDNDILAARILSYTEADILLILGHYEGFYKEGKLLKKIDIINQELYKHCRGKSYHGNGGFKTKLDAAKILLKAKKKMIIANIEKNIQGIIDGREISTIFIND